MVAGDAAADAVERARRLPALHVGLHLVLIEGRATRPDPLLTDRAGWFGSDQVRRGWRYFADPRVRRALAREIRAQFEAFAATGLRLDHANAHKHMHLHPTVGGLLIAIGREFGLPAVRVPSEPAGPLGDGPHTISERALHAWTGVLRAQVRRAGLVTTDHCFGLRWSGAMTTDRVQHLLANLPIGSSEIYFHPAAARDPVIDRWMPTYAHEAELAALRATLPSLWSWEDLTGTPVNGVWGRGPSGSRAAPWP